MEVEGFGALDFDFGCMIVRDAPGGMKGHASSLVVRPSCDLHVSDGQKMTEYILLLCRTSPPRGLEVAGGE